MSFDELKPAVAVELGAAESLAPRVEEAPLPERAQRSLDRATTLKQEKRFTEALIELEKASRLAPASRRVTRALALASWESGDIRRARKHIKEALAVSDDDVMCHYLLGRMAASRFENETAILE